MNQSERLSAADKASVLSRVDSLLPALQQERARVADELARLDAILLALRAKANPSRKRAYGSGVAALLAYLEKHPGATRRDVCAHMAAWSPNVVGSLLHHLHHKGRLRRTGPPKGGRYTVVKP